MGYLHRAIYLFLASYLTAASLGHAPHQFTYFEAGSTFLQQCLSHRFGGCENAHVEVVTRGTVSDDMVGYLFAPSTQTFYKVSSPTAFRFSFLFVVVGLYAGVYTTLSLVLSRLMEAK
jgi:hypothetical protein